MHNLRVCKQIKLKNTKKVVLLTKFFPPDFAATGQLLDELTKRLVSVYPIEFIIQTGMPSYAFKKEIKALRKTVHEKILINRSLFSKFFRDKSLLSRTLNGIIFSIEATFNLLCNLYMKYDLIIYTTEPPFLNFFAFLIHKINKKPYILIIYDLYPEIIIKNKILKKDNILIKIWNFMNKVSYSNACEIIILSDSISKNFNKYNINVRKKINIIPSWCNHEKIIPREKSNNPLAQELGVQDTFNILYSGNQGKCHDLITLIDTAFILREIKNIRFIIIGDGVQNKTIKNLSHKYKLKNCLFLPFQEKDVLPYSLTLADLSIVSIASNSKGLVAPSKLYGHLSIAKPIAVICPRSSYLKNLVEDNQLGKWFKNGDSKGLSHFIKNLICDKNLSYKYSQNSRSYIIKNANFYDISEKYYSLIKKNL